MTDEKILVDIWYQGLNDAFRKSRGPMAAAGCHDTPKIRLFYYGIAGSAMLAMGLGAVIVLFLLKEILWLSTLSALVAIVVLFQAFTFFHAFLKVKQASDKGKETDSIDPLRFKVMERALSWGLKKGVVVVDKEGKYTMNMD